MTKYSIKILLLLVTLLTAPGTQAGEPIISAQEALRQSNSGALLVIDVRSPGEWRQTGVPAGAKAISIHDPAGMGAFLDNVMNAVDGNKNARVALICAHGNRSHWTQQFLSQHGFTRVLDVSEGMLGRDAAPGWLARNLPVEKCERC
jgi:rhodanese-related sulfurtransferase